MNLEESKVLKLKWKPFEYKSPIKRDEILYEGFLSTIGSLQKGKRERKYSLTAYTIFRNNKEDDSLPQSYIFLDNPQLRLIREEETGIRGFEIISKEGSRKLFCSNEEQWADWVRNLRKICISENVEADYIIGAKIGEGSYSEVFYATHKQTKEEVAIKKMQKDRMLIKPDFLNRVINEISILRQLNHKYIIKLLAVYEDISFIYLILEYIRGGSLLARLKDKIFISDVEAATIIKKLLEAMTYCHVRQIVHLDLKLENILLGNKENYEEIKVCDFGFASKVNAANLSSHKYGSPGYIAPEIFNHDRIDAKADVFSIGVIIYILLTGRHPFQGKNNAETIERNRSGIANFPEEYWSRISKDGKDLALKMLQINPNSRPSCSSSLSHPWISMVTDHAHTPNQNMCMYYSSVRGGLTPPRSPLSANSPKPDDFFSHPVGLPSPENQIHTQLVSGEKFSHATGKGGIGIVRDESEFELDEIAEDPHTEEGISRTVPALLPATGLSNRKYGKNLRRAETPQVEIQGKYQLLKPSSHSDEKKRLSVVQGKIPLDKPPGLPAAGTWEEGKKRT